MKLRLNLHITLALTLLCFFGSYSIAVAKIYEPNVPQEIKFADVTFQLNPQSRAFVAEELNSILSKRSLFFDRLSDFSLSLPLVEPILRENGIPDDFKYLLNFDKYQIGIEATIQLEPHVYWALSRNNATEAHLTINQLVDERKHLVAATKGFTYCLNQNQRKFSHWGLSLFAHLADPKVLELLNLNSQWKVRKNLTLDNQAYLVLLEFFAYKIAIESSFPAVQASNSKIIYQYPYGNGLNLNKIAADLKVDPSALLAQNQWLKSPIVPDSDCKVLVVIPATRFFEIQSLAQLAASKSKVVSDLAFPIVESVEKLSKARNKGGSFFQINGLEGIQADICDAPVNLAYKAAISLGDFLAYNDLKENSLLKVGHIYYLEKKKSKAPVPFHVVREGESLWDISQIYGVRLDVLMAFNRFDSPQRLKRGRVIWLQSVRPKNKPIEYVKLDDEPQKIELIADSLQVDSTEIHSLPSQVSEPVFLEPKKNPESNENIEADKVFLSENIDIGLAPAEEEIIQSPIRKPSSTIPSSLEEKLDDVVYQVKENDTLFSVALRYKTTVEELYQLNRLSSAIVRKGMVLKIAQKK